MLNPLFTEEQLVARISETEAKLMVVVNELYGRVEKVIPKTTIKTVVSCAAVNSLGAIVKLLKKVAQQQGECKFDQMADDTALGHIHIPFFTQ